MYQRGLNVLAHSYYATIKQNSITKTKSCILPYQAFHKNISAKVQVKNEEVNRHKNEWHTLVNIPMFEIQSHREGSESR